MRDGNLITRLLDVPSTDPDDARRRKLLNTLLLGLGVLVVLGLLAVLAASVARVEEPNVLLNLFGVFSVALGGIIILYVINRYVAGWVASSIFLSFVLLLITAGDTPAEVANGRSLVNFAIVIVMAGVLLPPYASLIVAGACSLVILVVALLTEGIVPNPFAMLAFISVGFISWIAARNLEQALRAARSEAGKNLAVLESIADGVVVFDLHGTVTVASPAVALLAGRPVDRLVGSGVDTLMQDGVSADDREKFAACLKEKGRSAFRLQWGSRTCAVSVAPVADADGRVTGMVAVFHDFSAEVEVERVKRNFVSIASHELRTPVGAILGYAEILQEGIHGSLSAGQQRVVDRLISNAGQMLRLSNNLLDQARVGTGTLFIRVAPLKLAELLDNVRGVMEPLAENAGLALTIRADDDVPAVLYGDRLRLYQILVNLVSNGIKFTQEGSVDVRVYRPDENHWALQVRDTGRGIPEHIRDQIFDPFQKALAGNASDLVERGAGLGLAIVRHLAEMMAGEVGLESEVGEGTTFTIVLPLLSEADVNLDQLPHEAERLDWV